MVIVGVVISQDSRGKVDSLGGSSQNARDQFEPQVDVRKPGVECP